MHDAKCQQYDAVIIGAGMGGIYQLYRLLQLGLKVIAVDRAAGVGGTWFWNRYPGAQSDVHSHLYRYSWDKEDLQTYPWSENYLDSSDVLTYLNHIVDRHDLRKHILLDTGVSMMKWNDDSKLWTLCTSRGRYNATYVVTALGLLSKPNWPAIPGLDSFKGDIHHTARWPENLDLRGRRVGVIGNGSTGVQLITTIAPIVGSLLCFQRHPQYTVPAGRRIVSTEERASISRDYDAIWSKAKLTKTGAGFDDAILKTTEVTSEEREQLFQAVWERGGALEFMLGTFSDIITDKTANGLACDFIRRKIAEIVRDPEKRRKLTPHQLYARRPVCDTGYYDQFNRDNVDVVDILENPITKITHAGLQLEDGTVHGLDVIICATGFDAFDGAYRSMRIEGHGGITLDERWKSGPETNMGVAVSGFPNMFMILGPKSPYASVPPMIEAHVDFITCAIIQVEARKQSGKRAIESTRQGEEDWGSLCDEIFGRVIFSYVDSYLNGTNVPGKKASAYVFFGGLDAFGRKLQQCVRDGFPSFTFA
jgi:cyclohexanone monooxygenase